MERKKSTIKIALVFAILLAYYVFTRLTGLYIPCPFHALTGLYCPGCGVSHFCSDMLRLNFASAVRQNMAIAALLPVWVITAALRMLFPDKVGKKFENIVCIASVVALIAFGIMRNLPGFEFLLPIYTAEKF